jgi:hypothetical protein
MQKRGAETRRLYSERWREQDMAKEAQKARADAPAESPPEYDEATMLAKAQASSGDLVKVDWREKLPAAITKSEKIMAVVETLAKEAGEGDIQTRILEGILEAEETEQMVPGGKIPGIRDICRQDRNEESPQYLVFGFSVNMSDIEEGEGLPVYLVFDVLNVGTGEREIVGTGATQTVLSFYRMREKNRLPVLVRWFISRKETDRGFRPLNFELLDTDPLGQRSKVTAERVALPAPAEGSTAHESGWNAPPAQ